MNRIVGFSLFILSTTTFLLPNALRADSQTTSLFEHLGSQISKSTLIETTKMNQTTYYRFSDSQNAQANFTLKVNSKTGEILGATFNSADSFTTKTSLTLLARPAPAEKVLQFYENQKEDSLKFKRIRLKSVVRALKKSKQNTEILEDMKWVRPPAVQTERTTNFLMHLKSISKLEPSGSDSVKSASITSPVQKEESAPVCLVCSSQ
ncbi:MAG: hypothetical protein JWQ35_1644 [Bacteriovoracaceae bacterium]|nr:hypothetical protein [Bacteriovoracaceae bacterium]